MQGKPLAEQIQQCLIDGCDPLNHRKAKQADSAIYLMKKLDCPAVIIECGFLSNPAEEARLRDEAYHKQHCCRRDLRIFTQPERYVTEEI